MIGRATGDLVGLVMIVKDEAHGIRRTLDSFLADIDYWTILDTGSTDGTQDVVREVLRDLPGALHEEPFVDFASSRNRALDLHDARTIYTIMPDSDDYLVAAPGALRRFCAERRNEATPEEAYLVSLRRGNLGYCLPLLTRTAARWRYRGRVHEIAGGRDGAPPATTRVPDVELRQDFVEQSAEASRERWRRDLDLLRADLASDPRDARAAFYLAQTYECLGLQDEALEAYERRIGMAGWADETFEATLRRAGVLAALSRPWPEVQQAYLDAHQLDPSRAEPLYRIALHYYDRGDHALSYLFGRVAAELPPPPTPMFLDVDVYEWAAADRTAISAFYLAQRTGSEAVREIGKRLAQRAVRARPLDGRLRHNLSFYARNAASVFPSFAERPIEFSAEPPYSPLNPSIHHDGEAWRCILRTVNYRLGDGKYYGPGGDEIRTRNFMLELADDLRIRRVVEMIDRDPTARSGFPVHGFEDCRLFASGGRLFATCTVCDFTEHGAREIALLSIDPADYCVRSARPLRGDWSRHHQKNWMPFVDDDGAARAVYSTQPEVVVDILGLGTGNEIAVDPSGNAAAGAGTLRGGSQGVRTPAGWLFVVHTVDACGDARAYLHRFVLMTPGPGMRVTAMSEPFYFTRHGVEFCAGLALEGRRLVASYGIEDREARLGVFDLDDVLRHLRLQ